MPITLGEYEDWRVDELKRRQELIDKTDTDVPFPFAPPDDGLRGELVSWYWWAVRDILESLCECTLRTSSKHVPSWVKKFFAMISYLWVHRIDDKTVFCQDLLTILMDYLSPVRLPGTTSLGLAYVYATIFEEYSALPESQAHQTFNKNLMIKLLDRGLYRQFFMVLRRYNSIELESSPNIIYRLYFAQEWLDGEISRMLEKDCAHYGMCGCYKSFLYNRNSPTYLHRVRNRLREMEAPEENLFDKIFRDVLIIIPNSRPLVTFERLKLLALEVPEPEPDDTNFIIFCKLWSLDDSWTKSLIEHDSDATYMQLVSKAFLLERTLRPLDDAFDYKKLVSNSLKAFNKRYY